ncbi:hypothetical protein OG455_30900 [Kitasatospora sp. NBC_01287]|uniref:hypothetical protein n=1 Tax=Kitasatospora sp. NBC_01287 TaxID=2903573 RepID=UPI0022559D63|nr:hypothetical protein [Kitasatospora sp. NBC_01287]MCX4749874.1 hypothetical protein [Kitasatospora sp. NBC_01287]
MPIAAVATPRRAKLAFRLMFTVTALWGAVVLAFAYFTVRLGAVANAVDEYGDPDRAAAMSQFVTAFITVLAAAPTVLWLITTIAFRRGSRLAPVMAALVTTATVLCSALFLSFIAGFLSGEGYVVAFITIVDCLSVAAAFTAWTRRG